MKHKEAEQGFAASFHSSCGIVAKRYFYGCGIVISVIQYSHNKERNVLKRKIWEKLEAFKAKADKRALPLPRAGDNDIVTA